MKSGLTQKGMALLFNEMFYYRIHIQKGSQCLMEPFKMKFQRKSEKDLESTDGRSIVKQTA